MDKKLLNQAIESAFTYTSLANLREVDIQMVITWVFENYDVWPKKKDPTP